MKKTTPKDCCTPNGISKENRGIVQGILFGILPHTFCILFVVFSVIGATSGSIFLRRFLVVPYLFQILVIISLIFATISAAFYLRRIGYLSLLGIKKKWKYLSIMYSVTLAINLLLFFIIIPAAGNLGSAKQNISENTKEIPSQVVAGEQVIEMDQSGSGYSPSSFTVKANQPVRWIIHSKSQSCAASVSAPKLGISEQLNLGDNIIEFTPKSSGTFAFSCFMGMYRGSIKVVE